MNTFRNVLGGLLLAAVLWFSSCAQPPVQLPELPLDRVTPYFSEAAEVQTIDTSFYHIKNADGEQIGTLLFSMPYAEAVKGYNGNTPLVIALDTENRIMQVVVLPNHETPRFAERVAAAGLYDSWNGLTVEEALEKQVDAVSGATYTSNGVKNTLVVRLQAYQRQLQKDYNVKPSFWQRVFGKFMK
jgi:Na+-translocating ferredoxin:NAD+ oxidoreductase RnfG subunit